MDSTNISNEPGSKTILQPRTSIKPPTPTTSTPARLDTVAPSLATPSTLGTNFCFMLDFQEWGIFP